MESSANPKFLLTLHKECIRWGNLRERALWSPMFKEYREQIDGDGGSCSVDEVFISFLLDRLEQDLAQEEQLHPCEAHSEVDRSKSHCIHEEPIQCQRRRKSTRVSNRQTQKKTSSGIQSKKLSSGDDLTKQVKRSNRSTQKNKGTAFKISTEATHSQSQSTSKCKETDDLSQKLAIKTETDTVREPTSPATPVEESSKTAPGRGFPSSVCDPQSSSLNETTEKGCINPRTSKRRTKAGTEMQISKISKGIKNDKSEENKMETKRKRGRPGKSMDAAERAAMIFNKRLKEMQHQDLPKMFTCRTCGEQYQESENLRMHTITAHLPISIPDTTDTNSIKEEGETQFTHIEIDLSLYQQVSEVDIQELAVVHRCCPQCNDYVEDLKNHLETHMVKNYICEDCGKGFACQKQLRVHIGYHRIEQTGVMPYSCNFCDRTFRTIQALCIHRPLHNKARNYVCELCGKAFKSNGRLQKHTAIHAMQKRYSCSFCGRGFAQKCNMNRHLRIHTGEKPYCCHHCNQVFNHNVSLKRHMKKDHFIEMENNVQQPVKEVDNFPSGRMPICKRPL